MTSYSPEMKFTGADFDLANRLKASFDRVHKKQTTLSLEESLRKAGWVYGPGGSWLPPIVAPFNLGSWDIDSINVNDEKLHEDLRDALTAAKCNFTIEGASTVTLAVEDKNGELFRQSEKLRELGTTNMRLDLDGFLYRFVKVKKSHKNYELEFEDELVNKLRQKGRKKGEKKRWERGRFTRAQVIFALVSEVIPPKSGNRWSVFIPELLRTQPIAEPKEKPPSTRASQKEYGFTGTPQFSIEGTNANPVQINTMKEVLEQGIAMKADRSALVMAIMCILQESKAGIALNPNPTSEGVGAFSQIKADGWPATGNAKTDAKAFFEKIMAVERSGQKFKTVGYEINAVQISAFPEAYDQWKKLADEVVTAFAKGNAYATLSATSSQQTKLAKPYYFERRDQEDSWTCIQRLAKEVQWRAFVIRNTFYYVEEDSLLRAGPVFEVSEYKEGDGVDWIDYEKDVGQAFQTAKISALAGIWDVFPGSMVEVIDEGPAKGVWLVYSVELDIFKSEVEITVNAAVKQLPEPTPTYENISKKITGSGAPQTAPGGGKYGALIGNSASFAGPDQGIDFTGKAPVFCLDDCTITRVDFHSGWAPGGEEVIIVYELHAGPHSGRFVYNAEDIHPLPGCRPGAKFKKGEQIAEATGSGKSPGIECGFAQNSDGQAYGSIYDGKGSNPPNQEAIAFRSYVEQESK